MTDVDRLWEAVRCNPQDRLVRLVLADALSETDAPINFGLHYEPTGQDDDFTDYVDYELFLTEYRNITCLDVAGTITPTR